jgi:hypothetical protein
MAKQEWMTDSRISHIAPQKLDFLQKLVFEMQTLSDNQKLPFLMALATSTKKKNISFSDDEITVIIEVIKDYSSPEELSKVNKLLSMFSHT